MKKHFLFIIFIGFIATFSACDSSTPKPYGYFRIELPQPEYKTFDSIYPPCVMQISSSSKVVNRKSKDKQNDWIDIAYPQFNGRIHCSYSTINNNFRQLSEDSRNLVYKPHHLRADAIVEYPFENPETKVYGILYEITGNAASPYQFIVTDSTKHFLRGALYFEASPNADSIYPVAQFVKTDLQHLIETLTWK